MITITLHYFWWMLRPAYAVEYDYLPAYQSSRSLMTKKIEGLFFSGQINGTTGYEEATAQVHTRYPECPVCKALVEEEKLVPLYGRGKNPTDPWSKPIPGVEIPHRSTGQRLPTVAQLEPNQNPNLNLFHNVNWGGGYSFGFGTFELFPMLSFQVNGFPGADYGFSGGYNQFGYGTRIQFMAGLHTARKELKIPCANLIHKVTDDNDSGVLFKLEWALIVIGIGLYRLVELESSIITTQNAEIRGSLILLSTFQLFNCPAGRIINRRSSTMETGENENHAASYYKYKFSELQFQATN
ncbi:uncharacterized protein LOC144565487 [Carex rostrata]